MEGEEELLDPRPPASRRVRVAAAVLAALAVVGLLVVRGLSHTERRREAGPPPTSAPTATPAGPQQWPSAPGPCRGYSQLALVTSTPPAQRTGITVLVGGDRLRAVEFDTGGVVPLSAPLPGLGYVTTLVSGYARAAGCSNTSVRIYRLGTDGRMTVVAEGIDVLFGPDGRAWRVTFPDDEHPAGSIAPLTGGRALRLPAGFVASAAADGLVIGNGRPSQSGYGSAGPLLLVDATSGRVRANLGAGRPLAVSTTALVWMDDCRADRPGCTVHRRVLGTGVTSDYPVPRVPQPLGGVFSPDGRRLAFPLDRSRPDPRFTSSNPFPPADVAILHLDSGRIDVVPGVELPGRISPELVFSKDSRWLVIGLDAGTRARLLAWRSGLTSPYETTARVPAQSLGGAPLLIWPPP